MELKEIKALILDFGGVVIDIDYERTIHAFKALGFEDFDAWYTQFNQLQIFDQLERGEINEQAFLTELQKAVPNCSIDEIRDAWNAIIIGFPHGRVEWVQQVRKSLPVHLLSNTNEIHVRAFNPMIQKRYKKNSVHNLFDRTYLSHEIGLKKPDLEVYQYVEKDLGLEAREILFVDDLEKNVKGARNAGWQVLQLTDIRNLPKLLGPFLTQLQQQSRG